MKLSKITLDEYIRKKLYMFKQLSFKENVQHLVEKRVTIDSFPAIRDAILGHNTFVLVGHSWGDGDSFSSMYALAYLLKDLGKNVKILSQQGIPRSFSSLMDFQGSIEIIDSSESLKDTEVVICVDIPHPHEIDPGFNKRDFGDATIFIEFDHHIGQGNSRLFINGLAAYDKVSSTAELLFHFMRTQRFRITHRIALCLFIGGLSDTSNFRFMTSSRTLKMGRALKKILQVTPNEIFEDISMLDRYELRLLAHLKAALRRDGRLGSIILDKATVERFLGRRNLSFTAFSIMVNVLGHELDDIDVLVYFYELSPQSYKVGLRKYTPPPEPNLPEDRIDLRIIADFFNGGGHPGAAGFTLELKEGESLEDKLRIVMEIVKGIISL